MNKRGVSITFNTIVIAAVALVVLIVLWAIFIGGIKKSSGGVERVEGESIAQVNDVSWCLPTTMTGKSCETDDSGCGNAIIVANLQTAVNYPAMELQKEIFTK